MLIRMAWVALDAADKDGDAATYFGGWEWLAMQWPDATPENARQSVKRTMRELVAAGLVKPERVAARHRNQRYVLTVDY